MARIGIVTLFGNFNYGNRLQNYAVQQLLAEEGYTSDTIACMPSKGRETLKKINKIILGLIGDPQGKRFVRFEQFNRDMLCVRKVFDPERKIPACLSDEYAYFVTGSDQVWNPELRFRERYSFFLQFARPEQRICVSPSIGVTHIEEQYADFYRDGLQGFRYLCCREKAGAEEISRISGKECVHLIDPTLAVSAEHWREIAQYKHNPKEDYAVLFFLGDVRQDLQEWVDELAREKGYKVIVPSDQKDPYYAMDPRAFVALIDGAKLVLTDSFHAAAFSVNLNTPFYVFDRQEKKAESNHMSSRIESLVQMFGLENCYVGSELPQEGQWDFDHANSILAEERQKIRDYLHKCLNR